MGNGFSVKCLGPHVRRPGGSSAQSTKGGAWIGDTCDHSPGIVWTTTTGYRRQHGAAPGYMEKADAHKNGSRVGRRPRQGSRCGLVSPMNEVSSHTHPYRKGLNECLSPTRHHTTLHQMSTMRLQTAAKARRAGRLTKQLPRIGPHHLTASQTHTTSTKQHTQTHANNAVHNTTTRHPRGFKSTPWHAKGQTSGVVSWCPVVPLSVCRGPRRGDGQAGRARNHTGARGLRHIGSSSSLPAGATIGPSSARRRG